MPQYSTTDADGMNGCFEIPYEKDDRIRFLCIVSNGDGWEESHGPGEAWEHISARAQSRNSEGRVYERVPNWAEMCWLKELFWNDDECVVQFHPPKKDYVNYHPHVLHLWKPKNIIFPTPPILCV